MKDKNDFNQPFGFDGEAYNQQMFGPDFQFMPQTNFTWSEVWIKAITQPSVATFQQIIRDPKASLDRAFAWVAGVIVVSSILSLIGQLIWTTTWGGSGFYNYNYFYTNTTTGNATGINPAYATGYSLGSSICCLPFQIIFALIFWVILVGVMHITARVLGGSGIFEKSFYGFAAIYAPLTLLMAVINLVPLVGLCISFFVGLYGIYVLTIAMKAVHNIGWGEAFVSAIAPVLLMIFFICACIALVSVAFMGTTA